jgi:hydrogenase/urease accessory protein HupE
MPSAMAHGLSTAFLDINEISPGQATIVWDSSPKQNGLRLIVSPACKLTRRTTYLASDKTNRLMCPKTISGYTLTVTGLGLIVSDVIVRIHLSDDRTISKILTMNQTSWTIPAQSSQIEILLSYIKLGIKHILSGIDHLLFVLGLFLLCVTLRQLFWTITAFTLAHSITLVATTLGIIQISSLAAEACIALSLILVALDIPSDKTQLKQLHQIQYIGLTFIFGLVHGLGFAGALIEIGLPNQALPMALFGFNLGVEIGQLLFIFILISLVWLGQRFGTTTVLVSRQISIYSIGILGMGWLFERLLGIVSITFS